MDTSSHADIPQLSFEQLADRFKLLSDSSRLQILAVLCQQECHVAGICDRTGLNQANVSKHLQVLKLSGIVACRRVGTCRYYRIVDPDLINLCGQRLLAEAAKSDPEMPEIP
jgi:DNA-binding transcriptional ArsR family regulator